MCEQIVQNWRGLVIPEPGPAGDDVSVEEFKAEIKRLRKELNETEMERAILAKDGPPAAV